MTAYEYPLFLVKEGRKSGQRSMSIEGKYSELEVRSKFKGQRSRSKVKGQCSKVKGQSSKVKMAAEIGRNLKMVQIQKFKF